MHVLRANLDFNCAILRTDHAGVQRAVVVGLGLSDVVVKFAGNRLKHAVHNPKRGIAILQLRHDHANRANVVELFNRAALTLEFVVDRINVLRATGDFAGYVRLRQCVAQRGFRRVDIGFTLDARFVQITRDAVVFRGLEQAQRKVFKLPFQTPQTQPVREWRKHVHHFARFGLRRFVAACLTRHRRRAQRDQSLGELDENDAHVVDHRQQHFAQHFRLLRLLRRRRRHR